MMKNLWSLLKTFCLYLLVEHRLMLSFFYLLTLGPYISLCNTRKPKMQLNYDMVLLITDPYKATIFEECFY